MSPYLITGLILSPLFVAVLWPHMKEAHKDELERDPGLMSIMALVSVLAMSIACVLWPLVLAFIVGVYFSGVLYKAEKEEG